MKNILISIVLLLIIFVGQLYAIELKDINSNDQLAKFIFQMTTENVSAARLLEGIKDRNTIIISESKAKIPVREIFGTIIIERFCENISLFESNKKYDVREICSFRDSKNQIWRFQIPILEERQYDLVKEFLEKLMKE